MTPARKKAEVPAPLDHPALSEALMRLAKGLDRRHSGESAPSYLELAVLVVNSKDHLDDLATKLIHYARRYEGTTWNEIAATFGVSRPTAYKRFGEISPNDTSAVSSS